MIIVPVSTRGEVVLPAEVMRHLGIQAGQKIGIVLLPQNRAEIRAAHELEGSVEELFGLLKNKASGNVLTIEEINQSISECDANERIQSDDR